MGLYATRTTISPRRSRRDLPFGFEACHPAHGAGDADPKTLGCRVARHAAFHHCPHNAFAKIAGKRHPPPPPSHGDNLQADQSRFGNPSHDSIRSETALTLEHGSWLNLIEGFFSKLAHSALRPICVASKQELKERILAAIDDVNKRPLVHSWSYKLDQAA